MNTAAKSLAAIAMTFGFAGSAFAQDAPMSIGDLLSVTCQDYLDADAATQNDYATILMSMPEGEVSADAENAGEVDTIANDVQAVAEYCAGNENANMTLIEVRDAMMAMGDTQ